MTLASEEHLAFKAVQAGDYELAKQSLLLLAQQGSANAMNLLGWMHAYNKIEAASKTEGASWYRKAAESGIIEGFYYSGALLLESGDLRGARLAFEKGAALGSMQAMYGLGHYLDTQGEGESEKADALKWLEKAAAQGHFPAQRRLLTISARKSIKDRILLWPRLIRLLCSSGQVHWKDEQSKRLY